MTRAILLLLLPLISAQIERPLDFPLTITRPSLVEEGQPASFQCNLGSGLTLPTDNTCRWLNPSGQWLLANVQTGSVQLEDGGQDVSDQYEASGDDTVCALSILSVNPVEDVGQWSCQIEPTAAGMPLHRGTFQIMEEGFLTDIRLPRHIQPEYYNLEMFPKIEEGDFTTAGSMNFTFKVNEQNPEWRSRIALHVRQIEVDEASVNVFDFTGNTPVEIVGHEYDLEREFWVIHLAGDMSTSTITNEYHLEMQFTSVLNEYLAGFYRSSYTNPDTGSTDPLIKQIGTGESCKAFNQRSRCSIRSSI